MKITLPGYVTRVLDIYKKAGFNAYVVGGAARDIILGKVPSDYDIASDALPDEGLEILQRAGLKTIDTSKKHGTVIAISEGEQIEITTFRIDGDYEDNRHPVSVTMTRNMEDDVKRRDFTVNSIYIGENGDITDLMGGVSDMEKKIIRTCGAPEERFREDALRILRAIRFSAVLGFAVEPETERAVHELKDLLNGISVERIRAELCKLLQGRDAERVIREYMDIFSMFVPELKRMEGFDQKSPYHDLDLLEHTLKVLQGVKERGDPNLCFAAILHDIGKPDVFRIDENGIGRMKMHEIESRRIAETFVKRFKFSNADSSEILDLISMHDVMPETKAGVRRIMSEHDDTFIDKLMCLQEADINAHSEYGKRRIGKLMKFRELASEIRADRDCIHIKDLKIRGQDIIDEGCKAGPEVGRIMKEIFDKVLMGDLKNDRDELLLYVRSKLC